MNYDKQQTIKIISDIRLLLKNNKNDVFLSLAEKYPEFIRFKKNLNMWLNFSDEHILSLMLCSVCGYKKKDNNTKTIFNKYCSSKCCANSKETILKKKQSCLDKYGVEHISQYEPIKNVKAEKMKAEDGSYKNNREKSKKTCLDKYGVENVIQNKEIRAKADKTIFEKYGVQNVSQNKEIQELIKSNNLEKYGVDSTLKLIDVQNKRKQTFLDKYGVEYPLQVKFIREKSTQTNIDRYGLKSKDQLHITNIDNLNKEYVEKNFIKDNFFLVDEFCEYFNCSETLCVVFRRDNDIQVFAKKTTKTQNQIFEWLSSLKLNVINSTKSIIKPKELDIYLPDHKLAIEYDGLMFHSFGSSKHSMFNNASFESINKNNHLNKTEECEKQGIQLLHIFENEWKNKQALWKSVILSKIGLNERIYARKCQVKEINLKEANNFLIENHLQGECIASIRFGLFFNDKIVSVMTFGKSRFNKNYQYELIRFCSLVGINVVGGASKLFNYFVKNFRPKSVISYANRRWSNGNLYRHMGFLEFGETKPNYFYFKNNSIYSRIQFQKHKLKSLLDNYDDNLSETENMYNNDYRKIYDCGNLVFGWFDPFSI